MERRRRRPSGLIKPEPAEGGDSCVDVAEVREGGYGGDDGEQQ
jgi:hypothetical protein